MQLFIVYVGKLQTPDILKDLLEGLSAPQLQQLSNSIAPAFYEFHAHRNNKQSIIYRTHDEIERFLRKWNKKARQVKKNIRLDFDSVREKPGLKILCELQQIHNEVWFLEFFDLVLSIPGKICSFSLKKQSGGRYAQYKCCLCIKWKKCSVLLLNDGIITYDSNKNKISQFLHFGKDFYWEVTNQIYENILYVHSFHRKMAFKANSKDELFIFIYSLDKFLNLHRKEEIQFRFNSYSPIRYNNSVQFFVDGQQYFQGIAHAIETAEFQVFICGWWVSPEFYLVRPCEGTNKNYRLDLLLGAAAKRNVKVHILVYYQSTFLSNDSTYTIQALQSMHSNIRVLRHPQIVLPTYWSHHQKLVVVDQELAFIGGLDLCYGRYDNQMHLINESNPDIYPGIQYNNCRIADFAQVRNYQKQNVSRNMPRLPWHDIAIMVKGKVVKDLTRHFIQYWNYASYQTHYADRYILTLTVNRSKKQGIFNNIKEAMQKLKVRLQGNKTCNKGKQNEKTQLQQKQRQSQRQEKIEEQVEVEKVSVIKRAFSFQNPLKQFGKKSQSSRKREQQTEKSKILDKIKQQARKKCSPTSETMCLDQYEKKEKNLDDDIITIHQQVEKQTEEDGIKKKQHQMMQTLIEIEKIQNIIDQEEHSIEQGSDYLNQRNENQMEVNIPKRTSLQIISRVRESIQNKIGLGHRRQSMKQVKQNSIKEQIQSQKLNFFACQALRSVSRWSIGCKNSQLSIAEAYQSIIMKAEKFIYIQNQFFISATEEGGIVKNRIMQTLCKRIIQAIKNQEQFRVIILMPLIPGFAGQLDDPSASLPRVIMNWQYKTICRGQNSLFGRLLKYTEQPNKYIQFFGLRTHGLIQGQPVTQIIYLHSKLIIVDDRFLICGSANINDRSMLGNRDSQLCLLVQSIPNHEIYISKQPFLVVEKIHKLRLKLWQEHFGITHFEARNPMSKQVWSQITTNATRNTQIYRNIFGCYPDNEIKKLIDIKKFKRQEVDRKQYDEQVYNIKGHAVIFPLQFLSEQKLTSYHPHAIST